MSNKKKIIIVKKLNINLKKTLRLNLSSAIPIIKKVTKKNILKILRSS